MKTFQQFLIESASPQEIGDKLKKTFGHEIQFSAGHCSEFAIALGSVLESLRYDIRYVIVMADVTIPRKKNNIIKFPMHVAVELNGQFLDSTGCFSEEQFLHKLNVDPIVKFNDIELYDDYTDLRNELDSWNDYISEKRLKNYLKEYDYRIYRDLVEEISNALM